ncbi:MAG: arginine--tRNA ligase [Cyclobacteriaceae bacterium]|nr:arginine--tRNA ligase [Cyclobacteriaceae bacterium]
MNLDQSLKSEIQKASTAVFNQTVEQLQLQPTNAEFEGSHTLVCFPLTKLSRKSPEETAKMIGEHLVANSGLVSRFNVVKGFLNLTIKDSVWAEVFASIYSLQEYLQLPANGREVMVEYSSPNTNKPLHLGHLRNNFLGYSVAEIYSALGYNVHKVQIINDRGIHICKSMAAWQLFGNGETPESSGLKGDKLVGKYYVKFEKEFRIQLSPILNKIYTGDFSLFNGTEKGLLENLIASISEIESKIETQTEEIDFSKLTQFGFRAQVLLESALDGNILWKDVLKCFDDEEYKNLDAKIRDQKKVELAKILKPILALEDKLLLKKDEVKDVAQNRTSIMPYAQDLLRKWEAKDSNTVQLWKTMNGWVYTGFDATYKRMGVDFEKLYYESNTYLLGKDEVLRGVEQGVFFKKDDGSVWVDLSSDGLDQKVLLRSDGTSVYMTQDIGTAILRFRDFPKIEGQVYTVGNEQEYHFKVLFLILKKLGYAWAEKCYHLSYGMVDLPSGKMKSREGTVVDADDLMQEMVDEAEKQTRELGKIDEMTEPDIKALVEMVGLGALKFFLLKVDPKKRMLFDPNESIQLQGHTGPFIQYTHARIKAILRKATSMNVEVQADSLKSVDALEGIEREIIFRLNNYHAKLNEAAREYSPAIISNYAYELAKEYNQFYQSVSIFNETDPAKLKFRIALSKMVADVLKASMRLLGIQVPEKM